MASSTVAAWGSIAAAAMLLVGCSSLRGDIVWGTLQDVESDSATLTLGHTEDQTSYLFVCPGTSEKDLRAILGDHMPRKYPEDGYADKGGVALIPAQGPAKLRTYPTDEYDLCKASTTWQPTDITTPVTMHRDADGAWYPQPSSTTASSDDGASVGGTHSHQADHPAGHQGHTPPAGQLDNNPAQQEQGQAPATPDFTAGH